MSTQRVVKIFEDWSLWPNEHFHAYLEDLEDEGYSIVSYKKNFNFLGLGTDVWEIICE